MENEFSQDKLLARVNKFLKTHTFSVNYPLIDNFYPIIIKVELTDFRELIRMGEYSKYLMYTIYMVPSGDEDIDKVMKNLIPGEKVINNPSSINQSTFYLRLCNNVDNLLESFLEYWGQGYPVFCNKLVNLYPESGTMNENLIVEGKLDSVVRKLVGDIIGLVRVQKDGSFDLPADISDDIVYEFTNFETPFSIDLNLVQDENVETFNVDGEFSRDDDTIFITIISNPNIGNTFLYDLTAELNEVLAHELTHIRQHEEGYEFPEEPKKPKKYYSQEHELEAPVRGFKRKAKVIGKSFDDVVKDWFDKNEHKHRLKPKQVEKIIEKLRQSR